MTGRSGRGRYQRVDRVAELVREIVASGIARLDDLRLVTVSITGVEVDNELNRAVVFYDVLDDADRVEAATAFDEHRHRLQQTLGRQSRLRRTPTLSFEVDPSIGAARRIEEILDGLDFGADQDGGDGSS